MQFIPVFFNVNKFFLLALINAKIALPFFLLKNGVRLSRTTHIKKNNIVLRIRRIFLLKEIFFTSPQLKITLFITVLLQLAHLSLFYLNKVNNEHIYKEKC
jgi:hypothetical protein